MAMLVDEYPSLYPGEDADVVAGASTMIDVFLAREIEGGNLVLETLEDQKQILFHGHCQQKATFGTESTMQLLNAVSGYRAEMIDSGCCGMAGSFGYEEEHYDLSIQLAEMTLAPIIREAPDDVVISASGTSCRQQIYHTTGKMPLHPIEIVAAARG
jgi:Fe-S oxidoreductase